jgi:gas vesicle protein
LNEHLINLSKTTAAVNSANNSLDPKAKDVAETMQRLSDQLAHCEQTLNQGLNEEEECTTKRSLQDLVNEIDKESERLNRTIPDNDVLMASAELVPYLHSIQAILDKDKKLEDQMKDNPSSLGKRAAENLEGLGNAVKKVLQECKEDNNIMKVIFLGSLLIHMKIEYRMQKNQLETFDVWQKILYL